MNAISVAELAKKRADGDDFMLLDVREPDEIATAAIAGATLIPMAQVPDRLAELPTDKPIYVLCHVGGRSGRVTQFLNENGYANAANITGGIRAWSVEIDPSVPQY